MHSLVVSVSSTVSLRLCIIAFTFSARVAAAGRTVFGDVQDAASNMTLNNISSLFAGGGVFLIQFSYFRVRLLTLAVVLLSFTCNLCFAIECEDLRMINQRCVTIKDAIHCLTQAELDVMVTKARLLKELAYVLQMRSYHHFPNLTRCGLNMFISFCSPHYIPVHYS